MTLLEPSDDCTEDRTIDLGAAVVGITTVGGLTEVFSSVSTAFSCVFALPALAPAGRMPREKRVIDRHSWQTSTDRGERGGTRPL
jgi:hypothetical protein